MSPALPLAMAAALASCAPPHAIPVKMEHASLEERDLVESAADLLGYGVDWRSSDYGAVRIDVIREGSEQADGKHLKLWCRRIIWAEDSETKVAHELGHALGLHHVPDVHNVMHKHGAWPNVEDWQLETMDAGLRRIRRCGGR